MILIGRYINQMRVEIESEVYKWLCIMSVIKPSTRQK